MKKEQAKPEQKQDVSKFVANLIKEYRDKGADVDTGHIDCEFFDSGNIALNYILSGKFDEGWPVGQMINIHGLSQTGKSFLVYNAIANFLKKYSDGVAILDDSEWAYVDFLGSNLGIDTTRFMRFSNSSVEEHYEKIFGGANKETEAINKNSLIYALHNNGVKHILVAVDSIAAWSTEHEKEVGLDKPDMSKAKTIKALFRNASPYIKKCGMTYMITNHLIVNIGDMFGPKYVEGSGNAPAYNSTVRVCLSTAGKIKKKDTDDITGVVSKAQTVKNRFAPPFRHCGLEISFTDGLSRFSGLIDLLQTLGIVETAPGGWYKVIGSDIKFQSKDISTKWVEIQKFMTPDKIRLRESIIKDQEEVAEVKAETKEK